MKTDDLPYVMTVGGAETCNGTHPSIRALSPTHHHHHHHQLVSVLVQALRPSARCWARRSGTGALLASKMAVKHAGLESCTATCCYEVFCGD